MAGKSVKAAAATSEKGEYGMERDHDVPWNDTKVKVAKALKMLGCKSPETGKPVAVIAEKAGVTNRDVRHYVYHMMAKKDHHKNPRKPLAGVGEQEGVGRVYYLTKEGAAIDPVKEQKAQEAAKAEK